MICRQARAAEIKEYEQTQLGVLKPGAKKEAAEHEQLEPTWRPSPNMTYLSRLWRRCGGYCGLSWSGLVTAVGAGLLPCFGRWARQVHATHSGDAPSLHRPGPRARLSHMEPLIQALRER